MSSSSSSAATVMSCRTVCIAAVMIVTVFSVINFNLTCSSLTSDILRDMQASKAMVSNSQQTIDETTARIMTAEQSSSASAAMGGLFDTIPGDVTADLATTTSTTSSTAFDTAVRMAQDLIESSLPDATTIQEKIKPFDVQTWDKQTTGGLTDYDRIKLAQIYGNATSVFEYGLGESTYIADRVGVRRYAGIDSDAKWVALARDKVSDRFRFYFADIGRTIAWGHPAKKLPKSVWQYQVMPLQAEPDPFDVYMSDGRWRVPCMILGFLHASARGADPTHTKVLLHDCINDDIATQLGDQHLDQSIKPYEVRPNYFSANHLLDLVDHSGSRLCVFQRKPATTDAQLYEFWRQNYDMID